MEREGNLDLRVGSLTSRTEKMRVAGSHIGLDLPYSILNKVIPAQYLHCGDLLVPQSLDLSI